MFYIYHINPCLSSIIFLSPGITHLATSDARSKSCNSFTHCAFLPTSSMVMHDLYKYIKASTSPAQEASWLQQVATIIKAAENEDRLTRAQRLSSRSRLQALKTSGTDIIEASKPVRFTGSSPSYCSHPFSTFIKPRMAFGK